MDIIKSAGGEAIAVRADVSNTAEVKMLFDAAIAQFGKVDILINNAGIALYKRIQETTDEEFDRLMAINLKGVFVTLREAATRLESGGRIVNISSSVTRLMLPTYGPYSASKAAGEQLTRVGQLNTQFRERLEVAGVEKWSSFKCHEANLLS